MKSANMATKQLANSSFRSLGISGVENAARGAKGAVTFLAAWCSLGQFDADAYRSLGPVTVEANPVEVLKGDQSYLEAVFRGAQSIVDKSQIPMTIREGEPHLLPSAQKHYSSLSGAFITATCHPLALGEDRLLVKDAAKAAGLNLTRIVSHPIAAITAYDAVAARRQEERLRGEHHLFVVDVGRKEVTASLVLAEDCYIYEVVASATRDFDHSSDKTEKSHLGCVVADACGKCVALATNGDGTNMEAFSIADFILTGELQEASALAEVVNTIGKEYQLTPRYSIDPQQCAAIGATIVGSFVHRFFRPICLSALFFSVGVGASGGLWAPLIVQNMLCPTPKQTLTLSLANIKEASSPCGEMIEVPIKLYFGDRAMTVDNTLIGRMRLVVPLMKKDQNEAASVDDTYYSVELCAHVSDDVCHVTATHLPSGSSEAAEFELSFGGKDFDTLYDEREMYADIDAARKREAEGLLSNEGLSPTSIDCAQH